LAPSAAPKPDRLRSRDRLLDPPSEVVEARFEDSTLSFGVCRQPFESAVKLLFRSGEAFFERGDCLGALSLQAFGDRVQAFLDTLRAGVADMGEPLREHALSLADERLNGPVELS
jgi:hypothetical protein